MIKSLEKIFFFLLILLLPTQFGLHFWPDWSYVAGIRVDYLSPTIYLTDLLIAGLLFCSLFTSEWYKKKKSLLIVFGILTLALVNSLGKLSPWASLLKWGKVLELTLFALYLISQEKGRLKTIIIKALPLSIITFAAIGFLQIIFQGTIGGWFYFLGERNFTTLTPGIALYNLFGKLLLRPYSTFPHPNVFGAYMFVAAYALMTLKKEKRVIETLAIIVGFLAALLSGSSGVYLGIIVALVLSLLVNKLAAIIKLLPLGAVLLSFAFLFFSFIAPSKNFPETIAKRISLAKASASMVSGAPLLGVGLNNFIVGLPTYASKDSALWVLQPVHNVVLLIFVEAGVLGLLLFVFLLEKVFSKQTPLALAMVFLVVTGMVDHYWVTIQQTQILFALLVGLLW